MRILIIVCTVQLLAMMSCRIGNGNSQTCLEGLDYDEELLHSWLDTPQILTLFRYNNCSLSNQGPYRSSLRDYLLDSGQFSFSRQIVLTTILDYKNDTSNFSRIVADINALKRTAFDEIADQVYGRTYLELTIIEKLNVHGTCDQKYGEGPYPMFLSVNTNDTTTGIDPELEIDLFLKLDAYIPAN